MKFSKLAKYWEELEGEASRNKMMEILAEMLEEADAKEVDKVCYLSLGRLGPLFANVEFNLAEKLMIRAVAGAYGVAEEKVRKKYKEKGDLGLVVEGVSSGMNFFSTQNSHHALSADRSDLGVFYSSTRKNISASKTQSYHNKSSLSVTNVYGKLLDIAKQEGKGSQERKLGGVAELLRKLDPVSAKYIVRIPLKKMRLGFSDKTILDALSFMGMGDKSGKKELEEAFKVRPDIGILAKVVKRNGIGGVGKLKEPKVGVPILMAQAKRMSSAEEILLKIGKCAIEPKIDGFRLQIHYKALKEDSLGAKFLSETNSPSDVASDTPAVSGYMNNIAKNKPSSDARPARGGLAQTSETFRKTASLKSYVKLFTRNLDDVTYMYPDIVKAVRKQIKAESAIFEGEAVAFNPETKEYLPFQETVQRKRKYDIEKYMADVPLRLIAFELLYLDGKSLLNEPYSKRRKLLEQTIKSGKNSTIIIAEEHEVDDEETLERLFDEAVSEGLEGVMAKRLDAPYQAGARNWNWIKYKRSYSGELADTIDCLVMGYDFGKGKRAQFGIGGFLVGVYDEKSGMFKTVSKVGTGLSDEQWKQLKAQSSKFKAQKKPKEYDAVKEADVDVWINPLIVVEIEADEITKSPIHTAGLALRFPRLKRFRDDKRPEQATTIAELKQIYRRQRGHKVQ